MFQWVRQAGWKRFIASNDRGVSPTLRIIWRNRFIS
jgi:hypothetical protein